ncbi:MAG TPA: class I SAM-dependent methyltransferase [Casimicrobiaceae bacterium]|nr:class I SAM-dependent methyltransferase [Casimicrobiaceae bacterium]
MIEFPRLPTREVPLWNGDAFIVGGRTERVISYSSNLEGWDDDLTSLHEAEAGDGTHPIDAMSRATAVEALRRCNLPKGAAVLEIGCSSGFLLRDLKRNFPDFDIVGSDVIRGALLRLSTQLPGVPLVQMDVLQCPLEAAQFDAIVAINVLEHIEDDAAALAQIGRLLKPGGALVVEVPQGPRLFDYFDAYLRHYRRYGKAELRRKLHAASLRVERLGSLGFVPYAAFFGVKKLNRLRFGARGERAADVEALVRQQVGRTSRSRVLDWLLQVERRLPFLAGWLPGIRCTAVARKS